MAGCRVQIAAELGSGVRRGRGGQRDLFVRELTILLRAVAQLQPAAFWTCCSRVKKGTQAGSALFEHQG